MEETINVIAQWKDVSSQYVNKRALCLGKVQVAYYYYDATRPSGSEKKYAVKSSLPTIMKDLGRFATESECEERCMQVLKVFLKQLQSTE